MRAKTSGPILFLELGSKVPTATFDAFFAALYDAQLSTKCQRVAAAEDLEELSLKPPTAVILNTPACANAHYVIECILQHPHLCLAPLVILYQDSCGPGQERPQDWALWKEYSQPYLVPVQVSLVATAAEVLKCLRLDAAQTIARARQALQLRQFFHALHNSRFDDAAVLLEPPRAAGDGDAAPSASWTQTAERLFLRGLLHKASKDFDGAFAVLGQGLLSTKTEHSLEPKFLHLIGNVSFKRQDYKQARNFLEAAHKLSPRNLRRQFILAQLYLETGDKDQSLAMYEQIYAAVPGYPGIHARLVELYYQRAKTPADLAALATILPRVSELKLIGLYKRAGDNSEPTVREDFLTLVAEALMVHGDRLAAQDDAYGALNLYTRAAKIVPAKARTSRMELLFRCCEQHLAAADPLNAKRFLQALINAGVTGERLDDLKGRWQHMMKQQRPQAS